MNRYAPPPNVPHTVSRLYFEHDIPVVGRRKLLGQTLAHELLKAAQAQGIEQALAFNVTAGYLRGDALHHGHHEYMPVKHPPYMESINKCGAMGLSGHR